MTSVSTTSSKFDGRIFVLTIAVFITGLAENVFIGVLPNVARGLGVAESEASLVISIFSITYALYAPVAALVSYRFDAKATLIISIAVFAACNIPIMIDGTGLGLIGSSRVLAAAACAQISVCAVVCAVQMVAEKFRARAIGLVFLGISASLFVGVPFGVWITYLSGWRAVGMAMIAFAGLAALLVAVRLPDFRPSGEGGRFGSLFLAHCRDISQMLTQLVSVLFVAGHFTLFTYLTSFAAHKGFFGPGWETLLYAVFGLSGIAGGVLAGTLSDLVGRRFALVASPAIYLGATLMLALSSNSIVFFASLSLWACASWSISPIVQSYIMDLARSPRDIVIGANVTAMHIGVAAGAALGGGLLKRYDISILPIGAAAIAALALITAVTAVRRTAPPRAAGEFKPSDQENS